MAYIKNTWVDQDVARPKTYQVTENQDGSITLTDDFGLITELGTPVDQDHMNHIENGIEGVDVKVGELTNLQTSDKTSIVNAINSVMQIDADRLHALKSYKDAGELLTDPEGLADVTYYAHSTYCGDQTSDASPLDPKKFTVTGTPTITDDGILTNSDTSNYLYKALEQKTYNDLEISFNYVFAGASYICRFSGMGSFYQIYNNGTGATACEIAVYENGSTSATIKSISISNITQTVGVEYNVKIKILGLNVTCSITNLSTGVVKENSITLTEAFSIKSGFPNVFVLYNVQSADYKKTFIKVDGVPVFSGNQTGTDTYTIGGSTVSVPYTLSKTGSKIVDSYYRTQVASVYSEFGYAPYYTLNEGVNFTLPQGELYGMLQAYCDGQWEYTDPANNTVSTANLTTNSPYDITSAVKSLLPDSNYAYECIFYYVINRTSDTTSSGYAIEVDGCEIMRDGIEGGGNSRSTGGQFIAVIKPDSTIKLKIENHHLSTEYTKLAMFRRLGKNN